MLDNLKLMYFNLTVPNSGITHRENLGKVKILLLPFTSQLNAPHLTNFKMKDQTFPSKGCDFSL